MRGYAVVDIETTGFSYARGHRILEIGVIELSQSGELERSWETLINPQRHIEATEIHGISAADVFGAPTFEQISDKLVDSLSDRVLVAHNAAFDAGFLHQELHKCGRCNAEAFPAIDTMKLARTYLSLPKVKLTDCCDHLGIQNQLAHSALSDADATAQLFLHFLNNTSALNDGYIDELLAANEHFAGLVPHPGWQEPILHSRQIAAEARQASQNGGWFAGLVTQRERPNDQVAEQYFQLLDAAFLDRSLSTTEQSQLLSFASEHGLGFEGLQELHESYVTLLLEKAWADGKITTQERDLLLAVARGLGIPEEDLENALTTSNDESTEGRHRSPAELSTEDAAAQQQETDQSELGGIVLNPGDRVTITGAKKYSTADWKNYLGEHGVEVGGLAKKTKVLVAADPDSQSGKARKAKEYGIPIIAEEVARDIIRFTD